MGIDYEFTVKERIQIAQVSIIDFNFMFYTLQNNREKNLRHRLYSMESHPWLIKEWFGHAARVLKGDRLQLCVVFLVPDKTLYCLLLSTVLCFILFIYEFTVVKMTIK